MSGASVGGLVRKPLRNLGLLQVRHVGRVRHGAARGTVARVYREVEHDFGVLAPPVALHAPAPEVLAAVWMMLREAMLVPGRSDRAAREAVAAAVSVANACPFCVTIHSSTLDALSPAGDGASIAADRLEDAADPRLRALGTWARVGAYRPAAEAAADPADGGGPAFADEQERAELVGVAVTLHYLNRMVNVFLGEMPLPPGAPAAMLGPVTKVLIGLIRGGARRTGSPGASLDLLPEAPSAADLDWARGSLPIAGAFARATAAIEEAGRRSVPEAARELLLARLEAWDGRPPPLQSGWIDQALEPLAAAERGPGRLVLLVALASYRVDDAVIAGFREYNSADDALIGATAWASLAAARSAGIRLAAAAERTADEADEAAAP